MCSLLLICEQRADWPCGAEACCVVEHEAGMVIPYQINENPKSISRGDPENGIPISQATIRWT